MKIYKIVNKINNKIYIGQTKGSIQDRLTQHANNQESVSAITAAIKKYGKENFLIEELAKADTQAQLDILEKTYIEIYSSLSPNGYNLKTGGLEGSRYSQESIQKMSKAKLGSKVSDETKDKMSRSHKSRLANDPELRAMRGRKFKERLQSDPSIREKFSKIRKEYWSDPRRRSDAAKLAKSLMTDDQKILISQRVKEAFKKDSVKQNVKTSIERQKRSVIRSDGEIFPSIKEAAIASGVKESSIIKNIKGIYKATGNFTFQYYEGAKNTKPLLYLLVGAPGAGKSWVANQLIDKFKYVSYDGNRKKDHLILLRQPTNKPLLYDPTFKISTFIRRHSDEFDIKLIAIQENEEVLRQRITERGGSWTETIMKRNVQVKKRYDRYGTGGFVGTSDEILQHLMKISDKI